MDEAARRQIEAGRHLAALKKKCRKDGVTWKCFVAANCDLSRERADELIRIAAGTLSIADARARKRGTTRASRARKVDAEAIAEHGLEQASRSGAQLLECLAVHGMTAGERRRVEASIARIVEKWNEIKARLSDGS